MVKCSESESSYMGGCRCDLCRKAHTDRERERRRVGRSRDPDLEEKKPRTLRTRAMQHDTLTRDELYRARGWGPPPPDTIRDD